MRRDNEGRDSVRKTRKREEIGLKGRKGRIKEKENCIPRTREEERGRE